MCVYVLFIQVSFFKFVNWLCAKMVGMYRSLAEDEMLAEEVCKYACLYDKASKGYKERDRVKNAWKEVELSLGYEEGV